MKSPFLKHISAGYPLLWLNTFEYERCINQCINDCKKLKRQYRIWDINKGVYTLDEVHEESTMDALQPIETLQKENNMIIFVLDYDNYIKNNVAWRALINNMENYKRNCCTFTIISPTVELPSEVSRYMTILDFNLPTKEEIDDFITEFCDDFEYKISKKEKEAIIQAGLGLTTFELDNALSLSLSLEDKLLPEFINEQKKQLIKTQSSLTINTKKLDFNTLYGLDKLKYFAKRMVGKGKGILLVGVPGGGKSHFANTLGTETNRVTINMDFGAMMGKLVGETEQKTRDALKTVDAMNPCILFIDEIEKGLAGVSGYNGDSGTSQRQGGQFLKWLSDHDSDVYVIATSNDISKLPPEYLRAERWDAIFFVDLPNEEERKGICEIYKKEYKVEDTQLPNIENWTGAEIKTMYRLASCLNTSLLEASEYVTPIYKTMKEKIEMLREWAKDRTIYASNKVSTTPKSVKRTIVKTQEVS
jgi:SpoVK/Ycf46/Vps4 family AAA+-type ATPase